jgi:hypothetical protein
MMTHGNRAVREFCVMTKIVTCAHTAEATFHPTMLQAISRAVQRARIEGVSVSVIYDVPDAMRDETRARRVWQVRPQIYGEHAFIQEYVVNPDGSVWKLA